MTYILRVQRAELSNIHSILYRGFKLILYTQQDAHTIKLYSGEIHFGDIISKTEAVQKNNSFCGLDLKFDVLKIIFRYIIADRFIRYFYEILKLTS